MTNVFGVIIKALGAVIGMAPVLMGLSSLHGDTPQQQQDTIVSAATAVLDEVENLSGKSFAADADVQAATRDVVDAVQRFHTIVTAKAKAAAAPATK
ncbi:MAG: hypothetical protein ACRD1V_17855 [Vicinamibacterales bacterium]